ncbi:unnamed protein product [Vitrella brassicaformis CCMP3155]|uniref:Uncharacterized protein n=1 Tax=Vitrella brassicaformis (strain CCMP3155) TaxID=1169540 RepID=A0A0G4GP65_VITBC|nr:unnamed protein product [Vitrella brassicaformis CCMP3155]|eukprot:CEM32075.1 unnamed protein product [Vitrella brassicaformis CCMP3155]
MEGPYVYGGNDPETKDPIDSIPTKRFEHSIVLAETPHSPVDSWLYDRVEAIDKKDKAKGMSAALLSS